MGGIISVLAFGLVGHPWYGCYECRYYYSNCICLGLGILEVAMVVSMYMVWTIGTRYGHLVKQPLSAATLVVLLLTLGSG